MNGAGEYLYKGFYFIKIRPLSKILVIAMQLTSACVLLRSCTDVGRRTIVSRGYRPQQCATLTLLAAAQLLILVQLTWEKGRTL